MTPLIWAGMVPVDRGGKDYGVCLQNAGDNGIETVVKGAGISGIGSISYKTLGAALKELESDGLIHREEYPQIPPRVEKNRQIG